MDIAYVVPFHLDLMLELCIVTYTCISSTDFVAFIPCFCAEQIGVNWPWHR